MYDVCILQRFFKKEFINNKSIIFNYKKEMIGELKADDSNK